MSERVFQFRKKLYAANKSLLPEGFVRLDYLGSASGAYIDTGIVPTADTETEIELAYMSTTSANPFGVRSQNGANDGSLYGVVSHSANYTFSGQVCYNGLFVGKRIAQSPSTYHNLRFTGGSWTVDGATETMPYPTTWDITSSALLFCHRLYNSSAGSVPNVRIKCLRMRKNGAYLCYYISVLCLSGYKYVDGNSGTTVTASADKPGMFDLITGKMFTSRVASEFDYEYTPPLGNNEIAYYASSEVVLYTDSGVVSHEFKNGRGVLKTSSAVTSVDSWLRGTMITSVEFPAGVTSIGNSAFRGCTSLALTSLPSGVTSINVNAFNGCWNTSARSNTLTLPATIQRIEDSAFWDNAYLHLNVPWSEGAVANAPWGLTAEQITYDYVE